MWHILQIAFHTALAITGAFCLLTAGLAYPGEEGQMQSALEDLWAKVDDRQKGALSTHTAFMQQVAKAASRGFDAVFGHRLLSLRCLGVSISYSIASFGIVGFADNCYNLLADTSSFSRSWKSYGPDLLTSGYLAVIYLFVGSIPLIFKKFRFTKIWLFLIFVSVPFLWEAAQDNPSWAVKKVLMDFVSWGLLAIVLAFGCDLLFIAATRKSLRWAGEMRQTYKIAAVILLNVLLGVGLMIAPFFESLSYLIGDAWDFWGGTTIQDEFARVVMIVAGSNTLDFLASSVFVVLALVLLIHRALWPLLNRSVFRLQEIGTRGRRAVLVSLGLGLLGVSTGANVAEWAKKASELLKG